MDDFVKEFLTETAESLAALDNDLVQLETSPGEASLVSRIFRTLHTIKGTCGFLGFTQMGKIAHAGENVLGMVREGTLEPTPAVVNAILRCVDAIKEIVASLEAGEGEGSRNDNALLSELETVAGEKQQNHDEPKDSHAETVFDGAQVPEDNSDDLNSQPPATLQVISQDTPSNKKLTDEAIGSTSVSNQSIRVSIEVLENLMTTVSELVLSRNQLLQLARRTKDSEFSGPLQRLNNVVSDIQEQVMKTRMQPIGTAWSKLPRVIRDLGRELGKKIELVMEGADTELDRQVLELIRDPLTHMVRNSADHGLESPAERTAAGKEETGTIRLNAHHEGGHIIITISDNGRGLNIDKIRQKAIQAGLVTAAAAAEMNDSAVCQFIWAPGFSTAAQVTSVSGRGVGMDVVKTNVERIGGTVDVTTLRGKGSTFTIKIPLTLAIVSALIVECAGERFAVPQISVVELVRANPSTGQKIEKLKDASVLRLRDRLLPLISLRDTIGLHDAPKDEDSERLVIVTQVGSYVFGILVDQINEVEEIVVKPVAKILKGVGVYSGNTILGDGSVCMILDPNAILNRCGRIDTSAAATNPSPQQATANIAAENERLNLLLVRAGHGMRKAIPLDLIARLEEIKTEDLQHSNGRMLVKYRDKLMPIVAADPEVDITHGLKKPVLVFSEQDRAMGLLVDKIEDIVESTMEVEIQVGRQDIIGSALVGDVPTEIINTSYFIIEASRDWFKPPSVQQRPVGRRALLVDDSAFFRNLLVPLVRSVGLDTVTAVNAEDAIALIEAGESIDLVITDIEMPGMSGYELARRVRRYGGKWSHVPIIGLSGHAEEADIRRGLESGFDHHMPKLNREMLIDTLQKTLENILSLENRIGMEEPAA